MSLQAYKQVWIFWHNLQNMTKCEVSAWDQELVTQLHYNLGAAIASNIISQHAISCSKRWSGMKQLKKFLYFCIT